MDVVLIFNGAGNQMSQYAFYEARKVYSSNCRAIYLKTPDDHYGYELDRMFGIKCPFSYGDKLLLKIFNILNSRPQSSYAKILKIFGARIIYENKDYSFDRQNICGRKRGLNFYWGGWHSEKNFAEIKEKVRKLYTFLPSVDMRFSSQADIIISDDHSVSVHIRRGDYIDIPASSYYQFGDVATLAYYRAAIKFFKDIDPESKFYFFSDDINWCIKQFSGASYKFVNCNDGDKSWRDMYLMTLCRNHIVANSTFSWWGAWLSHESGVVIRPKSFIRGLKTEDIYPDSWIQINY